MRKKTKKQLMWIIIILGLIGTLGMIGYWFLQRPECVTNADCNSGWVCSFGKCYPTGGIYKTICHDFGGIGCTPSYECAEQIIPVCCKFTTIMGQTSYRYYDSEECTPTPDLIIGPVDDRYCGTSIQLCYPQQDKVCCKTLQPSVTTVIRLDGCEQNGGFCQHWEVPCSEGYYLAEPTNPVGALGCRQGTICCLPEERNECEDMGGTCFGFGDYVAETCETNGMRRLPYECPQITLNTQCCG